VNPDIWIKYNKHVALNGRTVLYAKRWIREHDWGYVATESESF